MDEETDLSKYIVAAEAELEASLGGPVHILFGHSLDGVAQQLVESLDHEGFREELWYSHDEIASKCLKKEFTVFLVYLDEKLVGVVYGYGLEDGSFFLDELVSHIEGKGVGRVLTQLLITYCTLKRYTRVNLDTEESDTKGRHLRQFYERLGFKVTETHLTLGLVMTYTLPENA